MSESSERPLSNPDLGSDYNRLWRGWANQDIRKNTNTLLDREGVGADKKEFKLEMDVPHQLIHLLRLRSKRASSYGIVADILTITKGCQTKFVISHVPESGEDGKDQPARLSYQLVSEVKGKVVGSYSLTLQEGKLPKVDYKAKRRLGYKKIPKWVFRMEGRAADRDFQIIRDTTDFIVTSDPSGALYEKEYIEHQAQIQGDRSVNEYSQEAREIEAQARARVLKDWPGANVDKLN